jgi:hypothetical protein
MHSSAENHHNQKQAGYGPFLASSPQTEENKR